MQNSYIEIIYMILFSHLLIHYININALMFHFYVETGAILYYFMPFCV